MAEMAHSSNGKGMSFRPRVLVSLSDEGRDGLIDETHMEGLIMHKCSGRDIYHSNAFMVVTGKESDSVTEKYYKIQNKVFFKAFSVICKYKEICPDGECRINDATAAEFLLEQEIKEQQQYKGIQNIIPVHNLDETRYGIRYICPLTKLDEIAFPVRLFGRKLGVLIVGQISLPENREMLEKHIRAIIPKVTEEQQNTDCGHNQDCVLEKIKVEKNLEQLIEKICDTVSDIENGLIEYYKERQDQYVLEKSNELIHNLRESINTPNQIEQSQALVYPAAIHAMQYESIGKYIREQLTALCDTINAKKKEIFVPAFDNLANNNYDYIVNYNFKFLFSNWITQRKGSKIYCGDLKGYIPGIGDDYDLLLVADAPTYPIALALCSNDFLLNIEAREKELLQQTVCETFGKFAEFAQMVGMEAKSDYYRVYLDSYMSIQRHELGQSNAGYQMLIEEFKRHRNDLWEKIMESEISSKTENYIRAYLKQCDDFIHDSDAYLHTTMIRIQSTKYLIDFSEMNKTYFYPYEAFLFKWNQIYGIKAQEARLKFRFPVVSSWDITRPRMFGDPQMIEQVAYNLTNNAIKYALPGTEVFLDCRLNDAHDRYELIVENYGGPFDDISEVEDVFNFGVRGSNNKKVGSGLGLFLSKQIALAHGGDIICEMEKLSDFNWTLIRLYIYFYESRRSRQFCNDDTLYGRLREEWTKKETEISRCIAIELEDNAFTPLYVHQNILNGTAKYRFTFWIPYDGQ